MTDVHGFGCPYPDCRWSMTISPGQELDEINRILFDHCNTRHPGWTVEELKRYQLVRSHFHLRRN